MSLQVELKTQLNMELHYMSAQWRLNPFLLIKMAIYILKVFLRPWKKSRGMFSEVKTAHPVRYDSPLQIVMVIQRTFLKIWTSLGRVWQPAADKNGFQINKKCAKRALLSAEGRVTHDLITQQNSLQRAGEP